MTNTPPPADVSAELEGDGQSGQPSEPLGASIGVRVFDAAGMPVVQATVQWSTDDGGQVDPAESVTDADGRARAHWTLGPDIGTQKAHANVRGKRRVDFRAIADHRDNNVILLDFDTPDGSGETVHPDVVSMSAAWPAATRDYLVATPYPNGNSAFENPSLFGRTGGLSWTAPANVHNPVVKPTTGYLSDPDALYEPTRNELWIYYRAVEGENIVRLIRSTDGVQFSAPLTVVNAPNHTIVSPTVVRRSAKDWLMWSVNAGGAGCSADQTVVELRHSEDGISWSAPKPVTLSQDLMSVWHIDVQWIPSLNEFWALYNVKSPGNCVTPAVYLATSPDGESWTTYPSPVLLRGAIPAFQDIVYRSTFRYDPANDVIDFWYSGARYDSTRWVWRSAFQRRSRAAVFASIWAHSVASVAALAPRRGVPVLRDAP